MKRRTKIILIVFIVLAVLIGIGIYKKHNFINDRQNFSEIIAIAGDGNIIKAFDKMEEIERFSNPIINFVYQKFKKKIHTRFFTQEEIIENTSNNKIVNDISNIYRDYWRIELLKNNTENRTDTILYKNLTDYLISNNLTKLSEDSLSRTIKNDSELKRIIEEQGFKTEFKYRNGFQEVFIWDKETIKNYVVVLPKDTISTTVVLIESYHLNGYDDYATMGKSVVGGWAIKESATLYCNKNEYDLNSEKFEVSYLKHESLHFTDLNEYPNLSSADLEYRSKIIELMYCSGQTIYNRIAEFLNGASSEDRTHSHPYANYTLIKEMSQLLFNSEYQSDYSKWKNTSVEKINNAAMQLYKLNELELSKDKSASKII